MTIVSAIAILDTFAKAGVDLSRASVAIGDDRYAMPTEQWIGDVFAPHFRQWIWGERMAYVAGDSDCDDFALCAWHEAARLHRRTSYKPEGCGFAFGVFWYVDGGIGAHAINAAVVRVGDALKPVFFEPQEQRIIRPTLHEIASCTNLMM